MASPKTTPEEKLFAVIQGASVPSPRAKVQALSVNAALFQLRELFGHVDLPRINQALLVMIGLFGAFALIAPLVMQPQMDRVLEQAAKQSAPFTIEPPLQGVSATDEVVQRMRAQDPFRVGDALPSAAALPTAPPMPTDPRQLLADLRLVGISFGAVPTAMIEQISQQKTNVLKVGDQMDQFTVKDIQRDRVILRLGDQDLELF